MGFAEVADVPVWLVGDINRGGVFASLKGSLDILSKSERNRVQTLLINGFRGSRSLLDDALVWIEQKSGKAVAGVIPWLPLDLPEEDGPFRHAQNLADTSKFNIAVIAYPRMSNHDDIDPLASEADISVRFVRNIDDLQPADVVVLPGSKHVSSDLRWLRDNGFEQVLQKHLRYGGKVLGICGGMQMLGKEIHDDGVEGESIAGLGYLPLNTKMGAEKVLRQVDDTASFPEKARVTGYEIHHGISDVNASLFPFAQCSEDQQVWGTYVHGLFEQGEFRQAWLKSIGVTNSDGINQQARTLASLDLLADALEQEIAPHLLSPLFERRVAA